MTDDQHGNPTSDHGNRILTSDMAAAGRKGAGLAGGWLTAVAVVIGEQRPAVDLAPGRRLGGCWSWSLAWHDQAGHPAASQTVDLV